MDGNRLEDEIDRIQLDQLESLKSLDFDDKSEFNLLRNCALADVLRSLQESNINSEYSYSEGLYDKVAALALPALARDPIELFYRISDHMAARSRK